ncbi:VCBS repeat-containing protein, partial [bacterium]|nr:VCBS repeat-containing protein [bacterium]
MWFLNLSTLLGEGDFRTNRSYDLDKDGKLETFVLSTSASSILWIESINSLEEDTLWSFDQSEGLEFLDVEVLDLNGDGLKDLIAVPDLNTSIGFNSWLYVFLGSDKGFSNIPYTLKETLIDQENLRPTSLTLVSDE